MQIPGPWHLHSEGQGRGQKFVCESSILRVSMEMDIKIYSENH